MLRPLLKAENGYDEIEILVDTIIQYRSALIKTLEFCSDNCFNVLELNQ
jgi:hypothetical protein